MYKKHLECINHIPNFRQKSKPEDSAEVSEPEKAETGVSADENEAQPVSLEEKPRPPMAEPVRPVVSEPRPTVPTPPAEPSAAVQPVRRRPQPEPRQPAAEPTLHDRVDYTREQSQPADPQEDDFLDDDLTEVGIDLKAYSDIPETLKQEKSSHYSNLEFGDNVDLGKKRRKK